LGLLAACGTFRPEVTQGNIVTSAQLATLKTGMSRQQVQQALGSPLLQDVFNASRWDYIYRTLSGKGVLEQRVLTVFFDASNTVARWSGQESPRQGALAANTSAAATNNAKPVDMSVATTPTASVNTNASLNTTPSTPLDRDIAALGVATAVIPVVVPVQTRPAEMPRTLNATMPVTPVITTVEARPAVSAAPLLAAPVQAPVSATSSGLASIDSTDSAIQARIESWRSAWESKDLNRYAAHYVNDYRAEFANHSAWLAQRKRLMDDAGTITLLVYNFQVIQTATDEARASFTQSYQSRRLTEAGEKSLFFKRIGDEWKITTERFIKQN
jgi:outer membrane protein assembly factor BamE